ncbi:MAG TPA: asparaginase [Pseudomonas sp.]|uniref:asparaginase n=1 Tax=Pseudomonas sp. TaxID=306 RepID=UPI002ED9ACFA
MPIPKLAIAALGGTVSMQARPGKTGVTPSLSGEDLLASVPGLPQLADIHVETLCLLPSASLEFRDLLLVLDWANAQVDAGATAIIVTQGTDSLEESAFFLDLLWGKDVPMVVTGAMRPATQPGADGPANLTAAVRVALAPESRKRGVQVVMNDQIHSAWHVRKTDSLAVNAFTSPVFGPHGLIVENRVVYLKSPNARSTLPRPEFRDHRVAMLEAVFSDAPLLLGQVVKLGYSALVIAGFGAGHLAHSWANCVEELTDVIPVVIASRTGAGSTARQSYGFAGSELDLISKGAFMSGLLCPRKTRILLWLLIGCEREGELADWLERAAIA